jgi:formylglycine-generating enzyme required for sulfatase activity
MHMKWVVLLLFFVPALLLAQENCGIMVKAAKEAGVSDYDPGRMHAIVIGVNAYQHWPKLRCAVNDARAVASTLHCLYGFPTNQINLILDSRATRRNILAAFESGRRLAGKDVLVIYYAGHGWMDEVKNGYWIPVDADENTASDYISNNQIVGDNFKKYEVKHLLVVADSCFSGAMLQKGSVLEREVGWKLPSGFNKPSRFVMTSGDLQPVPEGAQGHSPFAERFLQFLKYGDQKAFGVKDLHVFIRKNLTTEAVCEPLDTPKHMPGGELALCRLDEPLKDDPYEYEVIPPPPPLTQAVPTQTGGLYVETEPAGALVTVGSRAAARSPATLRELPVGDVNVTVQLDGYETERFTATVVLDSFATKIVRLRKLTGRLDLSSLPGQAEIKVDDVDTDQRTPTILKLEVGAHTVMLRRDRYEPATVNVDIQAGVRVTKEVVLKRQEGPQSGQAWANGLGMEFVPVPGTEVLFCKWETRVKDFEAFVKETGYDATTGMYSLKKGNWGQNGDTWKSPGFVQDGMHPVCGVSWDDAQAFCKWLTEKERKAGRLKAGQEYRLPKDWEWSVVVGLDEDKNGTPKDKDCKIEGVYPWGRNWPPSNDAGNYAGSEAKNADWPSSWSIIDGFRDGYPRTAPVGSFKANKFGIFDLGGNVWEWCEDFYDGNSGARVLRGGSWCDYESRFLLSSYRFSYVPVGRHVVSGFRVVLSVR